MSYYKNFKKVVTEFQTVFPDFEILDSEISRIESALDNYWMHLSTFVKYSPQRIKHLETTNRYIQKIIDLQIENDPKKELYDDRGYIDFIHEEIKEILDQKEYANVLNKNPHLKHEVVQEHFASDDKGKIAELSEGNISKLRNLSLLTYRLHHILKGRDYIQRFIAHYYNSRTRDDMEDNPLLSMEYKSSLNDKFDSIRKSWKALPEGKENFLQDK
jgi:hypothetical protein